MAHPRTFRFGVQAHAATDAAGWAALARKAEDLGFSSLFLPDHFGDQLAPMPAMMAAADATSDLRVGALVFGVDYKHPVVLAKEIATVDVLSDGRVEFGLGAGWQTSDYEQAGIPKDRDGLRIERLDEALTVVRGLWGESAFTFEGEHYRITDLDGLPKPVQRPHPPILIGGGGPKVLRVAAKHADIVSINPRLHRGVADVEAARDAVASRVDEKIAALRAAAGDRFDELELNVLVFATMPTDDRRATAENMAGMFDVTPEEVLEVPYAWIGSTDQICDQLSAARERWGFSYLVVQGAHALDAAAPVVAKLAGT
ncbi:MAG: TIGR03621 family F420-dependent LLM class oxidoreductase [Acidimicrobiales bacterium]